MKTKLFKFSIQATAFILFVLFAFKTQAQTSFSGEWKRNDDKTIVEGLSQNSVPVTLSITQDNNTLTIKGANSNGQGQTSSYTDVLKFDGSVSERMTYTNKKKLSSISWSPDKKELTQYSTYKNEDGTTDQTIKQTFSLTDGGKTLKVSAENTFGGNTYKMEEIFDKQ
jgi:hypothetical protein